MEERLKLCAERIDLILMTEDIIFYLLASNHIERLVMNLLLRPTCMILFLQSYAYIHNVPSMTIHHLILIKGLWYWDF